MRKLLITVAAVVLSTSAAMQAQSTQPTTEEGRPGSTNSVGQAYPKVDAEGRATFRLHAPDASRVRVSVGPTVDMVKGPDGDWTGTTRPLVPGFHYYWFTVDGATVSDPGSDTFFGIGKMYSGIEIPEKGVDFYDAKDVPHGDVRWHYYFSPSTHATRRCAVYTPPGYDADTDRYPVLYLQHGAGEDVRGWSNQGRVNFILDNLIAAGKAKPMIVVMEDGGVGGIFGGRGGRPMTRPATGPSPGSGGPWGGTALGPILLNETIPMIDALYRTRADREHRAMAGLSMGGMQTFQITLAHLDTFAYIGGFSSAGGNFPDLRTAYNGVMADAGAFNSKVKVLFLSAGTAEKPMHDGAVKFHQTLDAAGIHNTFYESPGTAHEWQTWRRSLHEFAPLLFRD